jgi:hypothetical protein
MRRHTSGTHYPFPYFARINYDRDNEIHVDERHRTHAPDSIFGIYIPTTPLHIPFDLDGVIAGFHSRQPTESELDNIANHVELTSEVEWIPHSFSPSLAEEEFDDSEFLSTSTSFEIQDQETTNPDES